MKIRIAYLILLLLLPGSLSAKQVERELAYRVASNFTAGYVHGNLRSFSPALTLIHTATKAGGAALRSEALPLFYIYNIADNGGYVIISAEDNAVPVLAYSEEGSFQPEALPENLKNWLAVYEKEISLMIDKGYTASEENRRKWDELLQDAPQTVSTPFRIATASWGQSDPYNKFCPMDGRKRSLTGCVATAMGIAMRHHKWPVQGSGSHSYVTGEKQLPLSVDFNLPYRWDLMRDSYRSDWSNEEADAAATLLYHAGVAVEMDYTSEASGAYTQNVVKALIDHFGYDNSMYLAYKTLYRDEEWHGLIRGELDNQRPVIYAGVSASESGHQFIIDGYDSGNFYHVNWGWNGLNDGFFCLTSTDGKQSIEYEIEQDAVIGMRKAQEGSAPGYEFYFYESDVFPVTGLSTNVDAITRDAPFRIAFSYVCDYGLRDFSGKMGFFLVDREGRRKEELDVFPVDLEARYAVYDDTGETYRISAEVEEGDRIRMFYTPDEKVWKPVRGKPGAITELPVKAQASTASAHALPVAQPIVVQATASAIYVRTTDQSAIRRLTLFDLAGRPVKEALFQAGSSEASLPVAECPSGAYILSVETTKGGKQYKIIR
ncbi:MAG: thiol protease/hemagglutinin PrtT [Tannerellaceae bacterium]|jgi:hypothetical protein|nr:thiol protease/hemagglutinin PrtT [Tannerellaceae bacterium]